MMYTVYIAGFYNIFIKLLEALLTRSTITGFYVPLPVVFSCTARLRHVHTAATGAFSQAESKPGLWACTGGTPGVEMFRRGCSLRLDRPDASSLRRLLFLLHKAFQQSSWGTRVCQVGYYVQKEAQNQSPKAALLQNLRKCIPPDCASQE